MRKRDYYFPFKDEDRVPWFNNYATKLPKYAMKYNIPPEEVMPPAGKSEVWQYRVIYHYKDERVGQWSDVVSITVTG